MQKQKEEEDKNEMSPLCDECYKFSIVPLNHPINSVYKADVEEKKKIIKEEKLTEEEAIKKIQKSKVYQLCRTCNKTSLCLTHYKRALDNGEYYNFGTDYAMCDACCWFHIC